VDNLAQLEIRIQGKREGKALSPENYDISDVIETLKHAESLLYPNERKTHRPIISYQMEAGSVKHILTTSAQAILGFSAILTQAQLGQSIDFMETRTSEAMEYFQKRATREGIEISISTSIGAQSPLVLGPTTHYFRQSQTRVAAELYLHGKVTSIGGVSNPNIHLQTEEYGTLRISAPEEVLAQDQENRLYKFQTIRVQARQQPETGELDKDSIRLLAFVPQAKAYQAEYLDSLIQEAAHSWAGVGEVDHWLANLRGTEDE
jgi:hypothetical protein